jgi:two-component system, NarL family, sensor kinase
MDTHQTNIYTAILISSLVLATAIIYFAISMVRQQRKNLQLQRLNLLTEINAIEKERTRMAADLHDDLGPTLTGIKFEVESVEVLDVEDRELLQKASLQLDEAIAKVREISRNLIPSALQRKGFLAALTSLVNQTNDYTHLHIDLEYDVHENLDEQKSINLYRILQEVIQNALRHSKAEILLIRMKQKDGRINLICEDNGIGFDYEAILSENGGLGLRNFRSRVELMGGQLRAVSIPGKGTQYVFDVPLK